MVIFKTKKEEKNGHEMNPGVDRSRSKEAVNEEIRESHVKLFLLTKRGQRYNGSVFVLFSIIINNPFACDCVSKIFYSLHSWSLFTILA